MRSWQRAALGVLVLAVVAVAGIALNFTLLRLTQEGNDPVGKLSPRAVFLDRAGTSPTTTTPTTTGDDDGRSRPGDEDEPHDGDD
jgi:hypothetical protein